MLYDAYEKRIQKIANIKETIIKYKTLIISAVSLLFISIIVLISINGMILEDLTSVSSIQYGDDLILEAKAVFGDVDFEFKNKNDSEWSKEQPILPGTYEVRVVSSRSFGIESKGDIFTFSISAKDINIQVVENEITYGDNFNFTGELENGDYFVSADVSYSDFYSLKTTVKPIPSTVVIYNKDGVDVSTAYNLTEIETNLTFIPREIVIDVIDKEKTYDGYELISNDYVVTNLLDIHSTSVDISGSILNYGTAKNIVNEAIVKYNDMDISYMYKIVCNDGELKINQKEIVISTYDDTKSYDGLLLENTEIKHTGIINQDEINIISNSSILYYGEVENKVIVTIGNNNNYSITYDYGKLSISKREITIETSSDCKTYDGTVFYSKGYTYDFDSLMVDDYFKIDYFTEMTFVDEIENQIDLLIFNGSNNISSSYEINYEYGLLEVTKRDIVVSTFNDEYIYNDFDYCYSDYQVDNLINLDSSFVTEETYLNNVGEVENEIIVSIYRDDKDITNSYSITYDYGSLRVVEREIFVVTNSFERQYDGTPLTAEGWKYNNTTYELVESHELYITTTGSITDIDDGNVFGLANNTYSDYTVTKGNIDVKENYIINIDEGILNVRQREILIKTNSKSKTYDGNELTCNGEFDYTYLSEQEVIENHILSIVITSSIINAGTIENKMDSYKVMFGSIDVTKNYLVQTTLSSYGTLTINKLVLGVSPASASKVYDGEPLTEGGWVYNEDSTTRLIGEDVLSYTISSSSTITDYTERGVLNSFETLCVLDKDGNVSNNYGFFTGTGLLTIEKRAVNVITASATKEYDDTELIAHSYLYNNTTYGLVDKHSLEIVYTGTITSYVENGVYNTYSSYKVMEDNEDKSLNYIINIELGNLSITKKTIVVETSDSSYIYNGEIQFNTDHDVLYIIDGHTTKLYDTPEFIDVVYDEINDFKIFVYSNEDDVTINYIIEYIHGELEITPRIVKVITASDKKVYDDTELIANGYEYDNTDYELVIGHVLNIDNTGSITTVGSTKNTYNSYSVLDDTEDKTKNYEIVISEGTLVVTQRTVKVITASATKEYDDTELIAHSYLYNNTDYELVDKHSLEIVYTGAITDFIENGVDNTYSNYSVLKGSFDVTDNYEIVISEGTLLIEQRVVEYKTGDDKKEYDGNGLTNNSIELVSGSLATNHKLNIDINGFIVDYGTEDNTYSTYSITCGTEDKTKNYNVKINTGTLSITKKVVSITLNSDEKVYDGDALIAHGYVFDNKNNDELYSLYDNETFVIVYSGIITNYGIINNSYLSYKITRDDDDITTNYDVTINDGKLEIFQREIYFELKNLSKEYNGTPLTNSLDDLTYSNLVVGDEIIFKFNSTLTYVDQIENIIELEIKSGDFNNNYIIEIDKDKFITITKKSLTISSNTISNVYDGNELSNDIALENNLVSSDKIIVTKFNSIIDVDKISNELEYYIEDKDGVVVTNCYLIDENWGTLEITTRNIVVKSSDDYKEYDGTNLSNDSLVFSNDSSLAQTDNLKIISKTEIMYYGNVDNELEFIITRNGFDVTKNYSIDYTSGNLEITKRIINVISGSTSDELLLIYNGESQKVESFVFDVNFVDQYSVTYKSSVTNVYDGITTNDFLIIISNSEAVESYDIKYTYGNIVITPKDINVSLEYASKTYDGTQLTSSLFTCYTDLCNSHEIDYLLTTGSITNYVAGGVINEYVLDSIVLKNTSNENDVLNYNFIVESDYLVIIQKEITIYSQEAEKVYDKEELFNKNISYEEKDLIDGDEIEVINWTSIVDVNRVKNVIEVQIGNDIYFENYKISYENDVYLEVTKKEISVETQSQNKNYDGLELKDTYLITPELIDGDELIIEEFTSIIDVGEIENKVIVSNDNYTFNYKYGTLVITKASLTIESKQIQYTYNGEVQKILSTDLNSIDYHTIELDIAGFIIPGEKTYTSTEYSISIYRDDILVNSNYDIDYQNLTLTINKAPIIISTSSHQTEYNGSNQFYNTPDILGDFYDEIILETTEESEIGIYDNKILDYSFTSELGNYDIEDLYFVEFNDENIKFEITKIEILIKTSSDSKTYDGTELMNDIINDINGKLLEGHVISVDGMTTITNVLYNDQNEIISIKNEYSNIYIKNKEEDVIQYYNISNDLGELKIEPAELNVYIYNSTKKYDDTYFEAINSPIITENFQYYFLQNSTFGAAFYTDASTSINQYTGNGEITLLNTYLILNDDDVTKNFDIKYNSGTITYSKINLTLTPDDVVHKYDGSSVYCTSVSASNSLLDGHTVTATVEGIRYKVGTTTTSINEDSIVILNSNDVDVTFFYNITTIEGSIVITN